MGSLADAINAQPRTRKGAACSVRKLEQSLDPADWKALTEALSNPMMSGESISRALKDTGIRIAGTTIQRHRRGDCLCL
jgi:hypothetical protein